VYILYDIRIPEPAWLLSMFTDVHVRSLLLLILASPLHRVIGGVNRCVLIGAD
jgi:hypothetical protein